MLQATLGRFLHREAFWNVLGGLDFEGVPLILDIFSSIFNQSINQYSFNDKYFQLTQLQLEWHEL